MFGLFLICINVWVYLDFNYDGCRLLGRGQFHTPACHILNQDKHILILSIYFFY